MATVNLWELITECSRGDNPNSDRCKEIKEIADSCHQEITFTVSPCGSMWTLLVAGTDGDDNESVKLTINLSCGSVAVTKVSAVNGITDSRTISFF